MKTTTFEDLDQAIYDNTIQTIADSPVYKQILADSFGGIMYNVANQGKYDARQIIAMWNSLNDSEQSVAGGIMKGAFNFLKGSEV